MNKKKLLSGLKALAAHLIIALHIAPFYIMINMSLKSASERTSRWLPPAKLYIQNYFNAMETGKLLRALGNTFLIVLCAVVIIVVVGAMAAYPLSRKTTRRNRLILAVIVGIMMVPQLSVLVPLYKEMVAMGGINRYWGVILVSATFNLPMAIYMYSNFIGTIPKELDEAAMIDGANKWQQFLHVTVPGLKPVMTTTIILDSVWWFKQYTLVYTMTGGGPGTATNLISLNIYGTAFNDLRFGKAAAWGIVVFAICYLISKLYRMVLKDD